MGIFKFFYCIEQVESRKKCPKKFELTEVDLTQSVTSVLQMLKKMFYDELLQNIETLMPESTPSSTPSFKCTISYKTVVGGKKNVEFRIRTKSSEEVAIRMWLKFSQKLATTW